MNIARILNDKDKSETTDGASRYILVTEDDRVIASHGCSNRAFANHDLTLWRLDELKENNIDLVISNRKVVWSVDGDNSDTVKEFYKANYAYESQHCHGYSKNWNVY